MFHIAKGEDPSREQSMYLCGNSLGAVPRKAKEYVVQELDKWQVLVVYQYPSLSCTNN